jgi:hypothetical protein
MFNSKFNSQDQHHHNWQCIQNVVYRSLNERLFFNNVWEIIQLYHRGNKILFEWDDDDNVCFVLDQTLCCIFIMLAEWTNGSLCCIFIMLAEWTNGRLCCIFIMLAEWTNGRLCCIFIMLAQWNNGRLCCIFIMLAQWTNGSHVHQLTHIILIINQPVITLNAVCLV